MVTSSAKPMKIDYISHRLAAIRLKMLKKVTQPNTAWVTSQVWEASYEQMCGSNVLPNGNNHYSDKSFSFFKEWILVSSFRETQNALCWNLEQ